jgi:hypothetical protein
LATLELARQETVQNLIDHFVLKILSTSQRMLARAILDEGPTLGPDSSRFGRQDALQGV